MAQFIFTCPHCKQQFMAEEEWIGKSAECPNCKQLVCIEKTKIENSQEALPEKLHRTKKDVILYVIGAMVFIGGGIFVLTGNNNALSSKTTAKAKISQQLPLIPSTDKKFPFAWFSSINDVEKWNQQFRKSDKKVLDGKIFIGKDKDGVERLFGFNDHDQLVVITCSVDVDVYLEFHAKMTEKYGKSEMTTQDGNCFETCWIMPETDSKIVDFVNNNEGTFGISIINRKFSDNQGASHDGKVSQKFSTMTLEATIDGSGKFIFSENQIRYQHSSWDYPSNVMINGRKWNNLQDPFMLEKKYNYSSAEVIDRKGRDMISMEKNSTGLVVYVNDSPNGAGLYSISIKLQEL